MRQAGAHKSAPYSYFGTKKIPAIKGARLERRVFSRSPALCPELILPVEVGIEGRAGRGLAAPHVANCHTNDTSRNRQPPSFRRTFHLLAKKDTQRFALCCNSKFRCRSCWCVATQSFVVGHCFWNGCSKREIPRLWWGTILEPPITSQQPI